MGVLNGPTKAESSRAEGGFIDQLQAREPDGQDRQRSLRELHSGQVRPAVVDAVAEPELRVPFP